MKKILLLSTASLAMLMADFTLEGDKLTPVPGTISTVTDPTTVSNTVPTTEAINPYLEPVNIPAYDSSDPSHLLITVSNGKWTSANLNSSTYKHFYVEPGDYSGSFITLTRDGTSGDRRSISLYNGNDTHPASLSTANQANVKIKFDDADYWDIDRMSFLSYQAPNDVNWFYNGSSYNTLNRINLKNYYYGIRILHNSNYNTIQKSYIDMMTTAGRSSDNLAIALTPSGQGAGTEIRGTKIIENDIRNACDGIQLIRQSETETDIHYPGTIIDNNNIWVDSDVYTDGQGNYTPNGEYQHAEDGMDFKAGSTESANPVIVTNNRMWGFRNNDGSFGGTTSFGGGTAFVIHYGVLNLNFNNNIIFDSLYPGAITNERAMPVSWSGEMKNNIFYDTGRVNPKNRSLYDIAIQDAGGVEFSQNTLIKCRNSKYMVSEQTRGSVALHDNVFIDAANGKIMSGESRADGNYYYNTSTKLGGTNETSFSTAGEANMGDYSFQYERYTDSPKTKVLSGIITTTSSPHYGVAGSNIQ